MTSVGRINQLYGNEVLDTLQREKARFVNSTLKVTLLGEAVSDTLEDGRVLSGVGGQYNFVAMAHSFSDGRSIITLRSTRLGKNSLESNIVFGYEHSTIPRHLRDIVVSEYGIANLRGKTDSECIKEMLNISDSRFQETLLKEAKKAGKVDKNYKIPTQFTNNYPEVISKKLGPYKEQDLFPSFPYGCAFTEEEIKLAATLKKIKSYQRSKISLIISVAKVAFKMMSKKKPEERIIPYLKRMNLDNPNSVKETFYQTLLIQELKNICSL